MLAANSKDIVTTPATRTKVVRIKENPLLLEIMKINDWYFDKILEYFRLSKKLSYKYLFKKKVIIKSYYY